MAILERRVRTFQQYLQSLFSRIFLAPFLQSNVDSQSPSFQVAPAREATMSNAFLWLKFRDSVYFNACVSRGW